MQQQSIMTLEKNIRFEGYVLIRMSEQRTGSTGNKYLDLTLADCTGEINGKLWDGNVDPPSVGSVMKVRGTTLEYNGRLQLRIEKMRPLESTDTVDMNLLTPSAPENPESMLQEITETAQAITSAPLRAIVEAMLEKYQDKILYFPAAQRIHHAERSGLLHHTLGMLRLAKAVVPLYPQLNTDLLFAGVILHDLCKIEEMDSDELGVVKDYTAPGLLLGHISLCVARIGEVAKDLGITGEPVLLLQHMILSHHGEEMYGSPRKPMFPEAEVLHWLDIFDARMNEIDSALAKVPPGVFSEKIWSLERRLYQPHYDQLDTE
ncbi:MAG TPA: HD domain-containing protein [Candidatus Limiplasma sp.]|nr:HD domain-containing protein [Candidatus Limiplasma sp.]